MIEDHQWENLFWGKVNAGELSLYFLQRKKSLLHFCKGITSKHKAADQQTFIFFNLYHKVTGD